MLEKIIKLFNQNSIEYSIQNDKMINIMVKILFNQKRIRYYIMITGIFKQIDKNDLLELIESYFT